MAIYIQTPNGLYPVGGQVTKSKIIEELGYTPSAFDGDYNSLNNKPDIIEDESDNFYIVDTQGNIIFKVDSNGIHSVNLTLNGKTINEVIQENTPSGNYNDLENKPEILEDESDELSIVDSQGNIVAKITSEGIQAVNFLVGETKDKVALASSVKLSAYDKMIHFSFDDTIGSLKDLTEKSDTYSSVFQQPFFKVLKELHDTYGAIFSCYCFNQILNSSDSSIIDFSLEDVTGAYAAEFTANAHWLKFGFHSLNGSMNHGSTTAEDTKTAYNYFITQIVRITGSVKCIDLVVRLQNFAGNKESCQALRDSPCGIIGFLAGDYAEAGKPLPIPFDSYTVSGYYLTQDQRDFLAHHGRYFDAAEQLYFYPSCLRLDNITSANVTTYMNYFNTIDAYGRSSTLIMYCHENQMFKNGSSNADYKKRMAAVCDWGVANEYTFGFPMNKIRQAY